MSIHIAAFTLCQWVFGQDRETAVDSVQGDSGLTTPNRLKEQASASNSAALEQLIATLAWGAFKQQLILPTWFMHVIDKVNCLASITAVQPAEGLLTLSLTLARHVLQMGKKTHHTVFNLPKLRKVL